MIRSVHRHSVVSMKDNYFCISKQSRRAIVITGFKQDTNRNDYGIRLNEIAKNDYKPKTTMAAVNIPSDEDTKRFESMKSEIENLQSELMNVQIRYQKLIEIAEADNANLRQQILLMNSNKKSSRGKIKKSLIDLYSEVLDELATYESNLKVIDRLPRVVVVGDQSSGKTSVLESIVKARIFPRGSGEMMTRSPVKVTLAEGPYHVAQFSYSTRQFDLTREEELADLRREVEAKMRASVRDGKTVSNEVISMTVKGPNLHRMVLVDLPGIISTMTMDMASDTKDTIQEMSKHHMSNPNAIILCIQDGSVDAERSNVTDIVMQCDPLGKRTIFVLTKVDLAEKLAHPERIQKILSGKLFPMKAMGYYAVVTGRGRQDDSIEVIRAYEEDFFRNSDLFQRRGVIMPHQVTTRNMSLAVSDCFWKMVKETTEQQVEDFRRLRFNLETEWKFKFPRFQEYGRDELFEKTRAALLNDVLKLSQISAKKWENLLVEKLWEKLYDHIFENIYLPAAQSGSQSSFNTMVDIELRKWAEQGLPVMSVEAGWETLQKVFKNFLETAAQSPDHDEIFDQLKLAVVDKVISRHKWEKKTIQILWALQINALEDHSILEKSEWKQAVKFLKTTLQTSLKNTDEKCYEMFGPGRLERLFKWKKLTDSQKKRCQVKSEIENVLQNDEKLQSVLSADELTTIKINLQRVGVHVDDDYINETWFLLYRYKFLKEDLERVKYVNYKNLFLKDNDSIDISLNQDGESSGSNEVILFWRIQKVIKVTANALRQQISQQEARRFGNRISQVLDEFEEDEEMKRKLLNGKRVTLAEEILKVRSTQDKLQTFINLLNEEK